MQLTIKKKNKKLKQQPSNAKRDKTRKNTPRLTWEAQIPGEKPINLHYGINGESMTNLQHSYKFSLSPKTLEKMRFKV